MDRKAHLENQNLQDLEVFNVVWSWGKALVWAQPRTQPRRNDSSPVYRERSRLPRVRHLSPVRQDTKEQVPNKDDPMLHELALLDAPVVQLQVPEPEQDQQELQNKPVAFLDQVFDPVPPPILPTPARRPARGRASRKSPVRLLDGGRKSERLAKKTAARLKPSKPKERAQEVLIKKAGFSPEKAPEDAKSKYIKLFKQPLTPQMIEAFSALVVGTDIGGKKTNVKLRSSKGAYLLCCVGGVPVLPFSLSVDVPRNVVGDASLCIS
uniref:Uncharacterized protein n=1 Tax=Leersia perrieri TaxID=77586 RepID=A0A0D9WNY9_9ORYZ